MGETFARILLLSPALRYNLHTPHNPLWNFFREPLKIKHRDF